MVIGNYLPFPIPYSVGPKIPLDAFVDLTMHPRMPPDDFLVRKWNGAVIETYID